MTSKSKQVIMAAGDLFTMMDMGLTDADSPATISQDDPAYAEFFDKLLQYKKVADLDVQDVSITVSIQAVQASTAREDSTQVNYRYAVTEASMNVNGVPVSYSADRVFPRTKRPFSHVKEHDHEGYVSEELRHPGKPWARRVRPCAVWRAARRRKRRKPAQAAHPRNRRPSTARASR